MSKLRLERTGAYRDTKELEAVLRRFVRSDDPSAEVGLWPEDVENIVPTYRLMAYVIRSRGFAKMVTVRRKDGHMYLIRTDRAETEHPQDTLNVRKVMLGRYTDDAKYAVRGFVVSDEPIVELTYSEDTTKVYQAVYRAVRAEYDDLVRVTRREGHIYLRRRDMIQPDEIDAEDETSEDTGENVWE